jgi:hypothetical protein
MQKPVADSELNDVFWIMKKNILIASYLDVFIMVMTIRFA